MLIYGLVYGLGLLASLMRPDSILAAAGHSLVLPGSGFMSGMTLQGGFAHLDVIMFIAALAALATGGFLWFATGNVILPAVVWIATALVSAWWQSGKIAAEFDPAMTLIAFGIGPAALTGLWVFHWVTLRRGQRRRDRLNQMLTQAASAPTAPACAQKDELSFSDLQHMRLLLERALQPPDAFNGFEWLDQFQTAAVRYQINFISYALSLAQRNYMPDFTGYMSTAQQNLKAKQENHRIWKYWKIENIWGNLRPGADPIARDNIMYSGFVGAQLAYARNADPRGAAHLDGLSCRSRTSEFIYSQDKIMQTLTAQYEDARYGLLSCEPNWVYPLCNAITATAIRAHDTLQGTTNWDAISAGFRHALETEFITPSGKLVPFRSNYTGFAPPQVGGAVMQAFPCFFLNAVCPDIARRQWAVLQSDMKAKNWRRALWPADVGNYGFSRASSYAATALAAREMGDDETADLLLQYMDADCPKITSGGVTHHSKASLWANANAFMARTSKANSLQNLVTKPKREADGIYLENVDPAEVLIAKAKAQDGILSVVAYPARIAGFKHFTIAGLIPGTAYRIQSKSNETFTANADGTHIIKIALNGRTHFHIIPII